MNKKQAIVCILLGLLVFSAGNTTAQQPSDTSTPEDWKANCALHHEYHNKLIFTAVETTDSAGKRAVAWSARNRAEYLAIFQKLLLDGVPKLRETRDQIVKKAGAAPGGRGVTILPELDEMVTRFWKDIEAAAKKHGVSCGPK